MPWFRKTEEGSGSGSGTDDIEFKPSEFKKEIETTFNTKADEIKAATEASLKPVLEFVSNINKEREERKKAEEAAARKKVEESNAITDEDFMLDPGGTINKIISPTNQAVMSVAARQVKSDTLGDKEYYYGDLKSKVDALIAKQPLQQQMNPEIIENCYKLIVFDHQKDIADGKLKARNTGPVFESHGTGGHSGAGKGQDDVETLSDDEKRTARAMGISDKDWISSRKELNYV